MTKAYKYGRPVTDEIYCILLGSASLTMSAKYASMIGLVVITLERYVKVTRSSAIAGRPCDAKACQE